MSDASLHDPIVVCRSCRRPLNREMQPDDRNELARYVHAPLAAPGVPDHEPDPIIVNPSDAVLVCDFCGQRGVAWSYPAETFDVNALHGSYGDWAACGACHDLIEAGDDEGLLERACKPYGAHVRPALRPLHDGFRAHRLGPAIPFLGGAS